MVERTLFDVTVKETSQNREYWAGREWIAEAESRVRTAKILVLPWEDFREGYPVMFPQGTSDFVKRLRAAGAEVELAATPEIYREIALHAHSWRFPTILVGAFLLPTLANVLGAEIHDIIAKGSPSDTIEMKVIIESDHGKCISIEYKGTPSRALDTLTQEAARCFPERSINTNEAPVQPQGNSSTHVSQKKSAQ